MHRKVPMFKCLDDSKDFQENFSVRLLFVQSCWVSWTPLLVSSLGTKSQNFTKKELHFSFSQREFVKFFRAAIFCNNSHWVILMCFKGSYNHRKCFLPISLKAICHNIKSCSLWTTFVMRGDKHCSIKRISNRNVS